jgi:hypothetical protein
MGYGAKDPNCPHRNQIRMIEFSWLDARGPGFARHVGLQLLKDEEFCLQMDSHSDMLKGYDAELLKMWGTVDNEYAVLSTAAPDISTLEQNVNDRWEVPHLCQGSFSDR